jgi:hypothetical protein
MKLDHKLFIIIGFMFFLCISQWILAYHTVVKHKEEIQEINLRIDALEKKIK